jgi:poly-gamma-glutamate synthesis protein (capsule biosynthesis protein)
VHRLADLSDQAADVLAERFEAAKAQGDAIVVSIHWGSNWGYAVEEEQTRFAHRLVDAGADVVHGHSSHHPRPIEVYRGRLVLYGAGDFINDYEGISGYEVYRGDLRLMYFADLDRASHALVALRMVPLRAKGLSLVRASREDSQWLAATMAVTQARFGTHARVEEDGSLRLEWP